MAEFRYGPSRGDRSRVAIVPALSRLVWGFLFTTSTSTVVVPCLTKSNRSATARETSTIRLRDVGPRSLTVASTLLPFFVFVIRTLVPHGRVLCAAVISDATYVLPHAVL